MQRSAKPFEEDIHAHVITVARGNPMNNKKKKPRPINTAIYSDSISASLAKIKPVADRLSEGLYGQ